MQALIPSPPTKPPRSLGETLTKGGPSLPLYLAIGLATAPLAVLKQVISVLQLVTAASRIVALDTLEKHGGTRRGGAGAAPSSSPAPLTSPSPVRMRAGSSSAAKRGRK